MHGGILARRDLHRTRGRRSSSHDIPTIDLVVVNLYPVSGNCRESRAARSTTRSRTSTSADPRWCASAAKNHAHVGDRRRIPADYPALLDELRAHARGVAFATLRAGAKAAFSHTAAYDGAISNYLTSRDAAGAVHGASVAVQLARAPSSQDMRYGENPHQQAAFYRDEVRRAPERIATARQLQGKELSLQQHRRQRRGMGVRARYFAESCVRHRQARQSLRRRARGDPARSVWQGVLPPTRRPAFGGIIAVQPAKSTQVSWKP